MKTMKLKLWLIATILLCLPTAIKANIQHTEIFSADELTIKNDTIDGLEFSSVNYGDLSNSGNPGDPSLPVKYLTFSVPYDAYNISVSATCGNAQEICVPMWLVPEQEPQAISVPKNPFTDPNLDIYDIDSYFPANVATISNEGFLDGDNHLITVAIRPVQFNGARNLVKLNKSINISISYISGNGIEQMAMKPILKYVDNNRAETLQQVTDMVANPNSVEAFRGPLAMQPRSVEPMEMFEYCVITSRELAPAFKRLIALKRHKGYDAGIVCMEDILACPEYQDGDVVSGINDDAGKLRAYLTDAYRYGTRYVLLGGKEPHVPVRYAHNDTYTTDSYPSIPTDMYFADLTGNWDKDCDCKYGEFSSDKVDFYAELFVGRLLCENIYEIDNYTEKLLRYELNPGNGDHAYLCRYYFLKTHVMASNDSLPEYKDYYLRNNIIPTFRNDLDDFYSGTDLINDINMVAPGFISFLTHSNPTTTYVFQRDLNNDGIEDKSIVCALDKECEKDEKHFLGSFEGNGFDNFINKDYPSIFYSGSCVSMPYEDEITIRGYDFKPKWNFGESFTLGKNYGGVAYLGNSRYGFVGESAMLEMEFLELLKNGITVIGSAETNSKYNLIHANNLSNTHFHIGLCHNLLGDPSIDMWTDIPQVLTEADVYIDRSSPNSISVSSQYLNGCTVVACSTNGMCEPKTATSNNVSFTNVSPNSHIVIYKHNMLPYLAPIQIQDEIINNSLHYFANMVNIGTFAYSDRESGNVILDNNADVVIEALGDVTLGPGLILNSGASLAIKTPGKVAIDGCIINNGATIKIEALETEITNEFNAQKGAVIEISKMSN